MSAYALPITIGLSAISSIVGAASQASQGQAAYDYSAYNASIAEENAKETRAVAAQNESDQATTVRRVISSQRAAAAASGVDVSSGSPLELMSETAASGAYDALKIRYAGSVQAANYESQAALDRLQGQMYRTAGYSRAGATLLGGASRVFSLLGGFGGGGASAAPAYGATGAGLLLQGPNGFLVGGV